MGLIQNLANAGDIDKAINEYRQLKEHLRPEQRQAGLTTARVLLGRLLIDRNKRLPVGQQDWSEVENLVKEADPKSSESTVLQTELLAAQGKIEEAGKLLEGARSRTAPELNLWLTSAAVLRQQRKLDDAAKLLDEAQKSLGDSVVLRLERSRLLMARGGQDLPKALGAGGEYRVVFTR